MLFPAPKKGPPDVRDICEWELKQMLEMSQQITTVLEALRGYSTKEDAKFTTMTGDLVELQLGNVKNLNEKLEKLINHCRWTGRNLFFNNLPPETLSEGIKKGWI